MNTSLKNQIFTKPCYTKVKEVGEVVSDAGFFHEETKEEIQLETNQRADVVLKGILRQIRHFFIAKFNKLTNYIKSKRGKGPEYFVMCLRAYVYDFSKNTKAHLNQSTPSLIKELKRFFGSIFYSKDMKTTIN